MKQQINLQTIKNNYQLTIKVFSVLVLILLFNISQVSAKQELNKNRITNSNIQLKYTAVKELADEQSNDYFKM